MNLIYENLEMPLTQKIKNKILKSYVDLLEKILNNPRISIPEDWLRKMNILESVAEEPPEKIEKIGDDLIVGALEEIIKCNTYIHLTLTLGSVNSATTEALEVYHDSLKKIQSKVIVCRTYRQKLIL